MKLSKPPPQPPHQQPDDYHSRQDGNELDGVKHGPRSRYSKFPAEPDFKEFLKVRRVLPALVFETNVARIGKYLPNLVRRRVRNRDIFENCIRWNENDLRADARFG
jgi:hypothetical protein